AGALGGEEHEVELRVHLVHQVIDASDGGTSTEQRVGRDVRAGLDMRKQRPRRGPRQATRYGPVRASTDGRAAERARTMDGPVLVIVALVAVVGLIGWAAHDYRRHLEKALGTWLAREPHLA